MKKQVYIIAEAGVNHNGSLETACRLVIEAKACSADAIKFQTFKTEKLVTRNAEKAGYQKQNIPGGNTQFDMLKKLELEDNAFRELIDCCRRNKIDFMSSPFDEESADMLDGLGMAIFKIPSGEITNFSFLEHIARKGRPVILSTGMSTIGEVQKASDIFLSLGNRDLTLLHCVTEYPAPFAEINLNAMITLRQTFKLSVGYSDHTPGIEIPTAAVALGATVIEKHFTLDNEMHGPDHRASLNPDDFKRMVQAIRHVELSLGDGIKRPAPCELKNREIVRKSIVAAANIDAHEILTSQKLTVKRPGSGIQPGHMAHILGMKVNRRIEKDDVLKWQYLK
jgi:N-acetylneuraminate synthase